MKKLSVTGLLILFSILDCFAQKKPEILKMCITEREYEVYDVVGIGNYQNATTNESSEYVEGKLRDISPETVADYKEKNSQPYLLRCVYRANGKTDTLRKSTGGKVSISFSRMGFSHDGNEALVNHYWEGVGNYCGGEFVILRKKANKWEIVKRVHTVIC